MKLIASGARFALVGIGTTLIHALVATSLIVNCHVHPGGANGAAFIVANLASYIANTCWSFKSRMKLDNWGRFAMVSFAAWVLTMTIASVVEEAGGSYPVGIALVIALVPGLTFIAHQKFTYR